MAYFNHAFNKVFIGTAGFVTDPGTKTNELTKGQFTFVDPTSWSVPTDLDPTTTLACPLILTSGAIYQNDKIGPFHGGYKESEKSKIINPKYVTRFYRVDPCTPQNQTISIGTTPWTIEEAEGLECVIPGVTQKDFLCGETYYLRLDLKGAPILRFLTRNSYFTADAYTGCCAADALAPTAVDPTIVYIAWAKNFLNSPLINPFIEIVVFDTTSTALTGVGYAAMTKDNFGDPNAPWNTYTSPGGPYEGAVAGMYITGAYVDTRFGDCTFYPNDSIIAYLEPVKIYASEVDYTGDPCQFSNLCVSNVCSPIQGAGYGENVVRELILSQAYSQSPFYTGTDLRIREITQGYDVTNTIDRNAQYTRYFIQHTVPVFNNPTSTFDNQQYLLEIITESSTVNNIDSTGASSSTAAAGDIPAYGTITVASTAGLEPGMIVTKTSGTGTIVAGAYIYQILSATQFTVTLGSATAPLTVALDGTTVLSATSASLLAFEDFVNSWLENAQGAACVQLETFGCPGSCTPPTVVD
jgi:hypothetical protein